MIRLSIRYDQCHVERELFDTFYTCSNIWQSYFIFVVPSTRYGTNSIQTTLYVPRVRAVAPRTHVPMEKGVAIDPNVMMTQPRISQCLSELENLLTER